MMNLSKPKDWTFVPTFEDFAMLLDKNGKHSGEKNHKDALFGHETQGQNVGVTERIFCIVGGMGMMAVSMTRQGTQRAALLSGGGVMLYRGIVGRCPVFSLLGVSTAESSKELEERLFAGKGITVEKSIVVDRPVHEVYRFWRNLSNLPRFMSHVESVKVLDDKHSYWVIRGPLNTKFEWEAEIFHEKQDEWIAWKSVDQYRFPNTGTIRFTPVKGKQGPATELRITFAYKPPGGVVTRQISNFFKKEPGSVLDGDLLRFKEIIETGIENHNGSLSDSQLGI